MEATFPLKPFYFVRHGETNWNKEARIMGQKTSPLMKREWSKRKMPQSSWKWATLH